MLLLLPLAVGTVKGYRRGLVLEVVSLLAFVLGVVGGLSLLSAAIPVVRSYLGELFGLLPLVAFLLVLVLIMWGVHLLGGFLKKAVHLTPLGVLDNLLGGRRRGPQVAARPEPAAARPGPGGPAAAGPRPHGRLGGAAVGAAGHAAGLAAHGLRAALRPRPAGPAEGSHVILFNRYHLTFNSVERCTKTLLNVK